MRVVKSFIAGLLCLSSSAAISAVDKHLLTLSCTAKDYLSVSVDVNSGRLSSNVDELASIFSLKVAAFDGLIVVTSPQFQFIDFIVNVSRRPERVKSIRFEESLENNLVVEPKSISEYGSLDVSGFGFFLKGYRGSLDISRGIRSGGVGGFFTEKSAGITRTLSFKCDQYNESQWRALTKPLYDYVLPSLKQDKN